MNFWDPQRYLLDILNGDGVVHSTVRGRLSNGVKTALAYYAADHELCFVSDDPEQRSKFLDYVCDMVSAREYAMEVCKDGYEVTKPDGSRHCVVAVAPLDSRPMVTYVNDGDPPECGAPRVIRRQVLYRK